jgi:cytochrome c oxidase cbb3-type subunit 3
MASESRDRLLQHRYDGIEEYDNPLPGWWVWLFWATIVFSAAYVLYYHLGPGPSVIAEYEAETRAAEGVAKATAPAAATAVSEASLATLQKDAAAMAKGKDIFAARCVACHGPQGQGLIGPNLTDDFWMHGGTLTEIHRVIAEGVPEKGMIPWKAQLSPSEISAVAAYVGTLRGTSPPNPKAPQGDKVSRAPEAAPIASR